MPKTFKDLFLIFFSTFVLFTISYLSLFHSPFFFHQKILFYRGIYLIFFLFFFFFLLILFIKKIQPKHLYLSALIFSFSVNLSLFIILPVTFDRSITYYLLTTLKEKPLLKNELNRLLINEYLLKNNALEKRLEEQRIIEMVEVKNNQVYLSNKGKLFLEFAKMVKKLYNLK